MTSARFASQMGIVRTFPLSHLIHSSSQFATSEVGQTMSARLATGPPSRVMPCLSKVQRSVMPCKVLPRPMSSARMHPCPSNPRSPMTHSNTNFTPSRWCGRRNLTSMLSTETGGSSLPSASTPSHSTKGSTPGGSSSGTSSAGFDRPRLRLPGPASPSGRPGWAMFEFDPHGTNRRRAARRRASSAECPAVAPAKGARKGCASTAATFWHCNPRTMGLRCTSRLPLSMACTFARLISACDMMTGSSSSSSCSTASSSKSSSLSSAAEEGSGSSESDIARDTRSSAANNGVPSFFLSQAWFKIGRAGADQSPRALSYRGAFEGTPGQRYKARFEGCGHERG